MRYAHNLKISVFCHGGEDSAKIKEGLKAFLPFDLEKEKIVIKETSATGFSQDEIKIFEAFVDKEKLLKDVMETILAGLSEDKRKTVARQAESRVDDECKFFLRFDKKRVMENGKLLLTDSGDCYHLAFSIAAFPKKKERAVEVVRQMFSE